MNLGNSFQLTFKSKPNSRSVFMPSKAQKRRAKKAARKQNHWKSTGGRGSGRLNWRAHEKECAPKAKDQQRSTPKNRIGSKASVHRHSWY